MFEYIKGWEFKQNEISGKWNLFKHNTEHPHSSVDFEGFYELPEKYRKTHGCSVIYKIGELYGVAKFSGDYYNFELINLTSIEACINLIIKGVSVVKDMECWFTSTKYSLYESHAAPNHFGVYDHNGNIVLNAEYMELIAVGNDVVAIFDQDAGTYVLRNLSTGEQLLENIRRVEKASARVIYYGSDYFTLLNVDNKKTCKQHLFRVTPYSLEGLRGLISCQTNDFTEGWCLEVNMEFYAGAIYSDKLKKLWHKSNNAVQLIDIKTGAAQVMPFPVAKSLGCPLL